MFAPSFAFNLLITIDSADELQIRLVKEVSLANLLCIIRRRCARFVAKLIKKQDVLNNCRVIKAPLSFEKISFIFCKEEETYQK